MGNMNLRKMNGIPLKRVLTYLPGDFSKIENFKRLRDRLKTIEGGPANRLYYLAAPPIYYEANSPQPGRDWFG